MRVNWKAVGQSAVVALAVYVALKATKIDKQIDKMVGA